MSPPEGGAERRRGGGGLVAAAAVWMALCGWTAPARSQAPATTCDAPASEAAARPVMVTFLGASTLVFTDGRTTIMTDGFFSRPSLLRMAFGPLRPDEARIDRALAHAPPGVAAVFVTHSHYDHAMDTAQVAMRTGAAVFGSPSTLAIVEAGGVPEARRRPLHPGLAVRCGDFHVTAVPVHHSPSRWAPGTVVGPFHLPAWAWEYPEGGAFSFAIGHGEQTFLVVPSANFAVGPEGYRGVQADVVFLAIGSLGNQSAAFTEAYWREAVSDRGARLVVPVHWDDFTKSLDEPLRPIPAPGDHVDRALTRLRNLAGDAVEVRLLQGGETLSWPHEPSGAQTAR